MALKLKKKPNIYFLVEVIYWVDLNQSRNRIQRSKKMLVIAQNREHASKAAETDVSKTSGYDGLVNVTVFDTILA